MKKRIITIIGARPQFVKAATISRLLKDNSRCAELIVHTGQHYDHLMSDIFFSQLDIPAAKYSLNIGDCSHGQMTGKMLAELDPILLAEKPDAVIVYGDTNSTLAGALAASKLGIPVVHIEAGLRSFNRTMPEEINRILTDHVSSLLLCPTFESLRNLEAEGIKKGVHHVGDVMYDATLFALEFIKTKEKHELVDLPGEDFLLLTIHRAEATDNQTELAKLLEFARQFAVQNRLKIVFPMHPRTRKLLPQDMVHLLKDMQVINPLGYIETQAYLNRAQYVLTDSGGLQKEAYFHGVPCITLRSETEWIETIESGWNKLWQQQEYKPRKPILDYGSGAASQLCLRKIMEYIN